MHHVIAFHVVTVMGLSEHVHRDKQVAFLPPKPPPPPVNHTTRPTGGSSGSGLLGTVRNVALLVHGMGEQVRGTLLGTIDDWENKGEQKHHNVARQGQAEIEEAYRQLWGTAGPSQTRVEPSAQTTGYDAAPPPTYHATVTTGTGSDATAFRPDSKNSSGT
ncbi:hypothetical protein B0H17DRAFT_1196854 [Mycena rosella]|uniref:Uncharacterized protein n=1 Tax=Mycena rosella TaxID=1033263 RepID=A0AAD7DUC7_MYCRO|nr:hypothetical protein B0H17DRAFT_1196854 [Mycena rosella]